MISDDLVDASLAETWLRGGRRYYYAGNRKLMESDLTAVVGWRKADEEVLDKTRKLVGKLNDKNRTIVTGMARGVDQTAALASMHCIGVLAEGILGWNEKPFGPRILTGSFLAYSELEPDAKWSAKWAMERNKTIANLARKVYVMGLSETAESSGTWNMVKYLGYHAHLGFQVALLDPNCLNKWNPSRYGLLNALKAFPHFKTFSI